MLLKEELHGIFVGGGTHLEKILAVNCYFIPVADVMPSTTGT